MRWAATGPWEEGRVLDGQCSWCLPVVSLASTGEVVRGRHYCQLPPGHDGAHEPHGLPLEGEVCSPVGYVAPYQEHRASQVRALEEKARALAVQVEEMATELRAAREALWILDEVEAPSTVPSAKERKKRQKALQRSVKLARQVCKGIGKHDTSMLHLLTVIESYDACWNALPSGWRVLVGRKMVSEYNARRGPDVEAPGDEDEDESVEE